MREILAKIVGVALAAFTATACQTVDINANAQAGSFMLASNAQVAPPAGFIAFCLRTPDQCAAPAPEQAQTVHLDQKTWDTLRSVNDNVNRTVRFEDDMDHYGRSEYWTIASDGYGDCDDYALTKRKALIEAGLPERALRVAVVRTRGNIGHAVLTVATDKGDFVLDNLSWDIRPWNEIGYTWISRQDADNPLGWVSLRTVTASVTGPSAPSLTLASR